MKIEEKPCTNFTLGRRGYQVEAIVIHIMEGTLPGTDSWFGNPQSKVSAHYGIGRDGAVHRYVQEKDTAWHAGRVSAPSWKLIQKATNGLFINPNYYTVGIEHEGMAMTDWTEAMYKASSALIADIAKRQSILLDRDHVIGHHEIYSVKTCPGFKVDINKLISLARSGGVVAPVGYKRIQSAGTAITTGYLNLRQSPDTLAPPVSTAGPNTPLAFEGYTDDGQPVRSNSIWYYNAQGNWFWSGGVKTV